MNAIRERQLVRVLNHLALEVNKPMLGICLGMQLFARTSHEHGRYEGLGWFDAEIVPITPTGTAKVPHVGWNSVKFRRARDWARGYLHPRAIFTSCIVSKWNALTLPISSLPPTMAGQ